jgi:hypothetical protein
MYICCVLVGAIKDSVSQNARCNSEKNKRYSFCLMLEASDHGYVLQTRRIHVTRYRIRYDIRFTGLKVRYTVFELVTMYNNAKRTLRKLQRFISTVILL